MSAVRVRIVHETNPQKYFPALYALAETGEITIVGSHRYSVVKEWLRSAVRDRTPFGVRTRRALADLGFRLRIPWVSGEVVLLGFAPWDWRICLYRVLFARNRMIYHTSWPDWDVDSVPRRCGPFTGLVRRVWIRALSHPNVRIVAVLDETRVELERRFGLRATVITHAVPEVFYRAGAGATRESGRPLRLIFVGELSAKKGVDRLLQLATRVWTDSVAITVVGDGPLRAQCAAAAAAGEVRFLGPIWDRSALAEEMATHDVLVLLSQRQEGWQELFGIVVTEALAAGLGVISTRHVGPEAIFAGRDLANLFDDQDLSGPTELIRRLAADDDLLAEFKQRHAAIADAFRIDSVARTWGDLIGAHAIDREAAVR
jgi:glycosyltransferase involved in cell wall biosynthesis